MIERRSRVDVHDASVWRSGRRVSTKAMVRAVMMAGLVAQLLCLGNEAAKPAEGSASTTQALMGKPSSAQLSIELAQNSDRVLLGRVVKVEPSARGPNGEPGIHSRVELHVLQDF